MLANFDFSSQVDACGGNMWVWHRKMIGPHNEKIGLDVMKQGEALKELPVNWQAHVEVVRNKGGKVRFAGIPDAQQDAFARLTCARPPVKIDDEHRRLMEWLRANGHTCVWNQDYRSLTTHTASLEAAQKR